jgi:predicted nucleic acid-binding protein
MGPAEVKWLLDSVILIDHFNGVDMATDYLSSIRVDATISVITRAEVLTGYDRRFVENGQTLSR